MAGKLQAAPWLPIEYGMYREYAIPVATWFPPNHWIMIITIR